MTLTLAYLTCGACPAEVWSVVPFENLDGPFECRECGGMALFAKPGVPIHVLPPGSERIYDWYESQPELMLLDPPDQDPSRLRLPCRS